MAMKFFLKKDIYLFFSFIFLPYEVLPVIYCGICYIHLPLVVLLSTASGVL